MTTEHRRSQVSVALSDEAIDWLVKLNSGRAVEADHVAFAEWRQRSDDHELAAREAETIWHGIGVAGDEARDEERRVRRLKMTRRTALGGGALAIAGLAIAGSGRVTRLFADYATGVGEQRTVALPDGSSVVLNAHSCLLYTSPSPRD